LSIQKVVSALMKHLWNLFIRRLTARLSPGFRVNPVRYATLDSDYKFAPNGCEQKTWTQPIASFQALARQSDNPRLLTMALPPSVVPGF
jgi:hypothetical protein